MKTSPPHKYFSIVRTECQLDHACYKKLYGELVYWVSHYYYSKDSKEMKYMLGATQ